MSTQATTTNGETEDTMTTSSTTTIRRRARLFAAAIGACLLLVGLATTPAFAEFGFQSGVTGFDGQITNSQGAPNTQAGSHPYAISTSFMLNAATDANGDLLPEGGNLKDVIVHLPAGLAGNPQAVPECPLGAFYSTGGGAGGVSGGCPNDTAVGVMGITIPFGTSPFTLYVPIYDLTPPPGVPAQFGVDFLTVPIILSASVRSGGDYGLDITSNNIAQSIQVLGVSTTFWGVPADPSHDSERGSCEGFFGPSGSSCPSEAKEQPFLTLPSACLGPQTTTIEADSWSQPGHFITDSFVSHDNSTPPNTVEPTGCEKLPFNPSIAVTPTTSAADSPSGLRVDLRVPQNELPGGLAEADLKDASVTLPTGMTVSPSSAHGLEACSPAQIALKGAGPAQCPDASKIGSVEIDTPLLAEPLKGGVFLAAQGENPFGSLLAIYVTAEAPTAGVVVKLAGHVEANPQTGQLTATFDENPQMPFSDLKLHFFGGPHAALMTPSACGTYSSTSTLTPWSGTAAVALSSPFTIGADCGGGFSPSFTAGTASSAAATYSPFVMSISRDDGEQQIKGLTFTMPPGLSAKLAGVPECSDAEAAVGTCPEASRIGSVTVASGAGSDPYFLKGSVYLTGPYNGGSFGEAVVVPANAGPFHLGNVVVRGSIRIDPHTAQPTIVSDPFPAFVGSTGIPTEIRRVDVNLDRPGFMFNPTSCEEMHVTGALTSTEGTTSAVSSRFQAAGCRGLSFHPKFSALIHAKHSRKDGEYLHVVVRSSAGEANIGKVHVALPKQLPSRLTTLKQACAEEQFAKDPSGCDAGSVVGTATAYTPVLPVPMEGPVYFVSNGGAKYPELVAVLQGDGVTVHLNGETMIAKGVTKSTFASVPDVPITRFDMVLPAGPHSALTGLGNLCKKKLHMPTRIVGQNGAVIDQSTKIAVAGCKRSKAASSRKHHGRGGSHKQHGKPSGSHGRRK